MSAFTASILPMMNSVSIMPKYSNKQIPAPLLLTGYFTITPTLNYDIEDRYLIENEFMAYLLQQTLQQTPQYFINMSNRGSVLKGS